MKDENNEALQNDENAGYTFKVNEGNTFWQYNLRSHNIYDNGVNTGNQIIRYRNRHIAVLRQTYKVVPHEDLYKIMKVATDELGLKDLFTANLAKSDLRNNWGKRADFGNATISHDYKMMSASFVSDKIKIGDVDKNHNVFGGVTITGSIDGGSSIRVIPFTLRDFCMNQMNHILSQVGINSLLSEGQHQLEKIGRHQGNDLYEDDFSQQKTRFVHRHNLKESDIADSIEVSLERAGRLLGEYKKLQDLILSQKMAMEIVAKLPSAAIKSANFLTVKKEKDQEVEVTITDPKITLYEVMNHFTNYLTFHSVTKSMGSNMWAYGEVDKLFFNKRNRTELLQPIKAQ